MTSIYLLQFSGFISQQLHISSFRSCRGVWSNSSVGLKYLRGPLRGNIPPPMHSFRLRSRFQLHGRKLLRPNFCLWIEGDKKNTGSYEFAQIILARVVERSKIVNEQ